MNSAARSSAFKERLMRRTEVGLLAESRFIDSPGRICQVFERGPELL
jgi:hypothetical protein